jgi:pimeloyl-ACP methyl ester carboxylesterase
MASVVSAPFPRRVIDPGHGIPALEILEAGDPAGRPLFFFHGWPSGAAQGGCYDAAAKKLGFRIIALNRPGIGRSAPDPAHSIRDWPRRVSAVADTLNIDRFHVLGVSGGGPYALATAWGLPDRVIACGVVSGAPPLHDKTRSPELFWFYRFLIAMKDRFPALAEGGLAAVEPLLRRPPPEWAIAAGRLVMCPRDVEAARSESAALSFLGFREAMDNGARAVMEDGAHYTQAWGIDPAEIRVPVRIWHGTRDHNFSWRLAGDLAARIPDVTIDVLEGEGHYSISLMRQRETLKALSAADAGGLAADE